LLGRRIIGAMGRAGRDPSGSRDWDVLDNWAGILCAGSMNRETTMVGAWSKLSRQRRTANIAGDPWRRQYESHGQFLSTAIGSLQRKADKRHETLAYRKMSRS